MINLLYKIVKNHWNKEVEELFDYFSIYTIETCTIETTLWFVPLFPFYNVRTTLWKKIKKINLFMVNENSNN